MKSSQLLQFSFESLKHGAMATASDLMLSVDVPPGNICLVKVEQDVTPPAKPDTVVESFFEENSDLTSLGRALGTGAASDRRNPDLTSQSVEFDHACPSGSADFKITAADVTAGAPGTPLKVLDQNFSTISTYKVTGIDFKVVVEFQ